MKGSEAAPLSQVILEEDSDPGAVPVQLQPAIWALLREFWKHVSESTTSLF